MALANIDMNIPVHALTVPWTTNLRLKPLVVLQQIVGSKHLCPQFQFPRNWPMIRRLRTDPW